MQLQEPNSNPIPSCHVANRNCAHSWDKRCRHKSIRRRPARGNGRAEDDFSGGMSAPGTKRLRNILEEAWGSLRPEEQAQSSRSLIAERILKMAATGERDPIRLRTRALTEVVASPL